MLSFTEEQRALAETVRSFAEKEIAPTAAALDESQGWNQDAFRKMGELGLLGITVSEKYGGSGLGAVEATIVMEEMGRVCASATLSYLAHTMLCVHNLAQNGSDEQRKRYLPKLISGEWVGAMALTEPGAGSDAMSLATRAEKRDAGYELTGTKTFITNGPYADLLLVYARTGKAKNDLSTFLVEKTFPGFRVSKKLDKMGMRASPTAELSFEHCAVPQANLVGEENDSISHMKRNLNIERITISGISLGLSAASLEFASRYAMERSQFGAPIGSFQMMQERIADMATQLAAGRALTYTAAAAFDRGENAMTLGAYCKLFTAPMATKAGLDAVQILGGYGYMKEYPVERFMRDAKLMEIGAGTNEVMRMIIAKEWLK